MKEVTTALIVLGIFCVLVITLGLLKYITRPRSPLKPTERLITFDLIFISFFIFLKDLVTLPVRILSLLAQKKSLWKIIIGMVVIFVAYGVVIYVSDQLFGTNLAGRNTSRTSGKVHSKANEIRINLVPKLYAQGQKFQYIKMPDAQYKKIVLTETIRVRSTGTKLTKVFAHFGAQKKGQARLKRIQNFGYVDFEHSYGASIFMIIPKGSIIEFNSAEDNTIWFSAANGERLVIEPEGSDSDIFFGYKKFVE